MQRMMHGHSDKEQILRQLVEAGLQSRPGKENALGEGEGDGKKERGRKRRRGGMDSVLCVHNKKFSFA